MTRLQVAQKAIALQQDESSTAQQIEAFLAARMKERTAQGLRIVTLQSDGSLFTCYPKDEATKQRWLDNYALKGVTVVEG